LLKRDTRVQIVIVENGKYILLKHLDRMKNSFFWGIPGGGREEGETDEEAALREAYEETGLKVKLLPIKYERAPAGGPAIYRRLVTYLACPVSGSAAVGYDPEAESLLYYRIVDMKWQDFYDDEGIDYITAMDIVPVREMVDSDVFVKRAGALVYKVENKTRYYLLVSTMDGSIYIMPQGHVEPGESPEEAAVRETAEESGAVVSAEKNLGFFLHQDGDEVFKTDIFLASLKSVGTSSEERSIKWAVVSELDKLSIHRETRKFILDAEEYLR
jgi:8-oxo-dGTP pyrophosphatase MutT (NUDIX family)